jgi:hypothetical protein
MSTGLIKSLQWSNQDQNRSGVCAMMSATDYSIEVLLDDPPVGRCGVPSCTIVDPHVVVDALRTL